MKPVTGPDGNHPIKDEQIRELLRTIATERSAPESLFRACHTSLFQQHLGESSDSDDVGVFVYSRQRCAEAWNARHGGAK